MLLHDTLDLSHTASISFQHTSAADQKNIFPATISIDLLNLIMAAYDYITVIHKLYIRYIIRWNVTTTSSLLVCFTVGALS